MTLEQQEFDFTFTPPAPANVKPPEPPADGVARFVVGHTYRDEWSYDGEDYSLEYRIVSRTRCTVTAVDDEGKTKTFHLCKNPEKWGTEDFLPWGNYSMAPVISARRCDVTPAE